MSVVVDAKDKKVNRRSLLKIAGGMGMMGVGAAIGVISDWADIFPPEETGFSINGSLERIKPIFLNFVEKRKNVDSRENRKLIHVTTYPMDKVMVENAARAFSLVGNTGFEEGKKYSFIDMIDLANNRKTYPTYKQSQPGFDAVGWGHGACLFSTMFARTSFPLAVFNILQAAPHPRAMYASAVDRYQSQLVYNGIDSPVSKIDVGVFVNDLNVLGITIVPDRSRVDMLFGVTEQVMKGGVRLGIYDQNGVEVLPNYRADFSEMRSVDIDRMTRDYYFLTASVENRMVAENKMADLVFEKNKVHRNTAESVFVLGE